MAGVEKRAKSANASGVSVINSYGCVVIGALP